MSCLKYFSIYDKIDNINISFISLPIIFLISLIKFNAYYSIVISFLGLVIISNLYFMIKFISDNKLVLFFYYINLFISYSVGFIIFIIKDKFIDGSFLLGLFIIFYFTFLWLIFFIISIKFFKYFFPKAKVMVLNEGIEVEQEINTNCNQISTHIVTVVD